MDDNIVEKIDDGISYEEYYNKWQSNPSELPEEIKEEYQLLSLSEIYNIDFPPQSWIIERWLPTTGITVLVSDAGVGKSFLSIAMIKAIVCGENFLEKFPVLKKVNVLVIDKENGLKRVKFRAWEIGIPPTEGVFYLKYPQNFTLGDNKFIQVIKDYIAQHEIGLVILDSLTDIAESEDLNARGAVQKIVDKLREINEQICYLILHHEIKPTLASLNRGAGHRAAGSYNIKAQVDYLFGLIQTKDAGIIHVEHDKDRDGEKLPKFAIQMIVEREGEDTKVKGFKYIGEVDESKTQIELTKEAIVNLLQSQKDWSMMRKDLIDALLAERYAKRTIIRVINDLEKEQMIEKILVGKEKKIRLLTGIFDDSEIELD